MVRNAHPQTKRIVEPCCRSDDDNLRESGHPPLKGTSALFRGLFTSKGGGRSPIHYNADPATAELLYRIIISVSHLSMYGAVADWCEELVQQISDLILRLVQGILWPR